MENHYDELRGKTIYISDINKGLINCYRIVRDNVNELINLLERYQELHSEKYYYDMRKKYNSSITDNIEEAATFIYLDRSAFGGMWRENKDGRMNSSFGGNLEFNINYRELIYYSSLLRDVYINSMSFEKILEMGQYIKGYFVYLSPPYDIINHKRPNFKQYNKDGFGAHYRSLLRKVFIELDKKECKVMMSNSDKITSKLGHDARRRLTGGSG